MVVVEVREEKEGQNIYSSGDQCESVDQEEYGPSPHHNRRHVVAGVEEGRGGV